MTPLDRMFTDPMLGPFRTMMQEVDGKGLTGPDVDEMRAQLGYMEQLAQEVSDIAVYSGKLAQENTFQRFSDAYSKALSNAARAEAGGSGGMPSDEKMLADGLAAMQSALDTYRSGQAGEEGKLLIPVVERIVEIGQSGVSYPVYLRMLEEEGLNRKLEGSADATRAGLTKDLSFAQQAWDRYRIEKASQRLAKFDELAAAARFGQPEPLEFELFGKRLDWEYEPWIHWREAVVDRWQSLLEQLVDWLDSFTSFAPYDPRWMPMGGTIDQARHNVQRTQECGPGEFRYHEAIFHRYFQLTWDQIWSHETFTWEYTARRIEWSDERLHMIRETYPHCQPGGRPPASLVSRAEQTHPSGRDWRPDKLQHPPWGTPLTPFAI